MTRASGVPAATAATLTALLACAGPAAAQGADVAMGASAFAPVRVQALVGDEVTWSNESVRAHTVTAADGSFDSGRLTSGATFRRRVATAGVLRYNCRLHAGMTGEVEAAVVLLDPPPAPAASGRPYPVGGRAALPPGTPVAVLDASGTEVASAPVGADGRFATTFVPEASTTLRAVAGDAASPPVDLPVLDRRVGASTRRVRGGRTQVRATVTPSSPGATVVLQLRLPLRFGWWPVEQARLGRSSAVAFRTLVRRRLGARVVLTLPDGATVLASTPAFTAGVR